MPKPSRPEPEVYEVREYDYVEVPMNDLLVGDSLRVNDSLSASDYFTLQLRDGRLQLQARGIVGLIPLNDRVTIDVRPRVKVRNFSRLLEIAEHTPAVLDQSLRGYSLDETWSDSLLDLYGRALVAQVTDIQHRGLYREYKRNEEVTSFPRGRILVGRTTTELLPAAVMHKAVSAWYQRTVDNACNQAVKYAIWFLGQRYSHIGRRTKVARKVHAQLNSLYRVFDGVTLDQRRAFMNHPLVSGRHDLPALRAYYRPALQIATAVIRQQAIKIERAGSDVWMPSLILKMDEIFEAYLRGVLRREFDALGWPVGVFDGRYKTPGGGRKPLFDHASSAPATPDIVVRDDSQTPRYPVLLEVKYKPASGDPDRDALNQAIAYAVSYRCNDVIVVQPAVGGGLKGHRMLGTLGEIAMHQYAFDLDAADILAEEEAFGHAVREIARRREQN